jgi:A/G-specific adenine glycosylase
LPVKKNKIKVRKRFLYYLIWQNGEKLAMKKRGPNDIWQGLFDFELIEENKALTSDEILEKVHEKYGALEILDISEPVKHILSHQSLEAVFIELKTKNNNIVNENQLQYYTKKQVEKLPKPRLIENYLTSKNI